MDNQKLKNSRRDFIKQGMAGLAGAAVLPSIFPLSKETQTKGSNEKRKIIYRSLGKTGITLPVISIGCGSINDPSLISAAIDTGIVYFDTAPNYMRGQSEEAIGKAVNGQPRDSFFIGTKSYALQDIRTGLVSKNVKPASFIQQFEDSLKRLRLDYVDILFLHDVVRKESVVFEPILQAMEQIKKDGKARFVGVSFHRNEPEILRAIVDSHRYDVVTLAYNFRQPHREEVKKTIAYAAQSGLGIIIMKALAGVYWDRERTQPINVTAALKWVLQDENVHTTIPGISSVDQIETDISVMENLTLTPEEEADLRLGSQADLSGLYCSQCEKCLLQCRGKLDIPTIMRSYMYAYGYRKPFQARETLESVDLAHLPCNDCDTCNVACTMGFDVRKKIIDIARIKDVPEDFLV